MASEWPAILDASAKPAPSEPTYHMKMQFGATVLYVDQVSPVVDFYRRAFGLEPRFFDETLGFAELETGAPCWLLLPILSAKC